jgi:hypothetical protein
MNETNPITAWVSAHAQEVRSWPAISGRGRQPCLVEVCTRDVFASGLCKTHWIRARRLAGIESRETRS